MNWIDNIKPGDSIILGKSLRLVRSVTRDREGHVHYITLAIRKCSWTKRAYTVYSKTDLKHKGKPTRAPRIKLDKPSDKKLRKCFEDPYAKQCLDCCDVLGWP